jgi:hypothetical protein
MDPSQDEEDVLGFYRFIGKMFIAPMVVCPHLNRKELAWRSHVFMAPWLCARGLHTCFKPR